MKSLVLRTLGILFLLLALDYLLIAGIGFLLTEVWGTDTSGVGPEDKINTTLAENRTPAMNDVSFVLSEFGNTITIIALLVVVAGALFFVTRRWGPSLFLVVAVSSQALVFLFVTLTISRDRPDVRQLDESPPTSSFPSGHTGASTALYVGLALLVIWLVKRAWVRVVLATVLLSVPLLVAFGRLYRGMHHPTDVLGAYLNGGICLLIAAGVILARGPLKAFHQDRDDDTETTGQQQMVGTS